MALGLTSSQKVAGLLLGIDMGLASKILRHMGEDQVELVTRAMKELEEIAVDEKDLREIYREAISRMHGAGFALGDVEGLIKTMVTKAFGNQKGDELLQNLEQHTFAQRPFAVFEQLPSEDLAGILSDEHPQIIAVFLAHMDSAKSGEIISLFPSNVKPDVVLRIAKLGRSSPEVVQRVVDVMRKKVKSLGLSTRRSEPKAWVKKAANIINHIGGSSEKSVLDDISEMDQSTAEDIREEMFTFDDLAKVDGRSMQKILGSIDSAILAVALKACSHESEENVFTNLSKRASEMVREERDAKGPMPLSEVLDAQKQILGVIRGLIEGGEVVIGGAGEKMV